MVWAAKPTLSPFVAPNRPHWKLAEILGSDAGQKSWSQLLMRDPGGLTAKYISRWRRARKPKPCFSQRPAFLGGRVRANPVHHPGTGTLRRVPQFHRERAPAYGLQHGDRWRCAVPAFRGQPYTRNTLVSLERDPTPVKGFQYMRAAITVAPAGYGVASSLNILDPEHSAAAQ
jgi:hypothetical protein